MSMVGEILTCTQREVEKKNGAGNSVPVGVHLLIGV